MAGDTYDAIVIGAGVNGLAAAAALARAGRRTLVLERNERTGGSGSPIEFAPGYFASPFGLDGGWLPPAVARALALAAPANADTTGPGPASMHVQPPLTVAVEPGRFMTLPSRAGGGDGLAPFSARDADAWPAFVERVQSMTGFLGSMYQEPAPDLDARGAGELLSVGRLALRLRRLGRAAMTDLLRTVPTSVSELADDTFESDALKAAIAAVGVRGIRQGPRSGGTAFTLLHNLIGAGRAPGPAWAGRFRPNGPAGLATEFEAAATRAGVAIRTNAAVAHVIVRDFAVAGVVLDTGEEIAARAVLSSADPSTTMLRMIDPVWLDPEFVQAVGNIRYRGCTSFVLYGLDGMPDVPGLSDPGPVLEGVVSLTPTVEAIERAYDATKYGAVAEHPHIEIFVPSLRWRDMAPAGHHVLVARVHYSPYALRPDGEAGEASSAGGSAGDSSRAGGGVAAPEVGGWTADRRSALADRVTDAIACVSPGFADRVLHRTVLTPRDIEDRFGWTEGAASQGEPGLDQILFMRPVAGWSRHAMPIDGLYLCGAGTHPGPGVAAGPGWLAAGEVLRTR